MRKLKVLTATGLTARLNDQGGLEIEGLKAMDPRGAEEMRRYIKEHKARIVEELEAQAKARPASPVVAAKELIDLDQREFIKLDLTSDPPTFTLADGHGYGEGDRGFVQGLIDEAGDVLPRF